MSDSSFLVAAMIAGAVLVAGFLLAFPHLPGIGY